VNAIGEPSPPRSRSVPRLAAKVCAWIVGIPLALLILLYLVLLVTPIPLPFAREPVRIALTSSLPEGVALELGDMSLALENAVVPVLKFTPVTYKDSKSGGRVSMEALDVGFSPFRALLGQPGASITMVRPHIQMVQDLLGPRLSTFEVVEDAEGGTATVRVLEGTDAFPKVAISSSGLDVRGDIPASVQGGLRSDNDWLIYNLEAAEASLRDVVKQADDGVFSRLIIKDGVLDMNDSVYGLYRQFKDITLDVAPKANGRETVGNFSASLGGRKMAGSISRVLNEDGTSQINADIANIDFASIMPFIDDPASVMAIRGAGALSINVNFDEATGKVLGGKFHIDMTGTDLRVGKDYFPIASSIMEVTWTPETGAFELADSELRVGQSSAHIAGLFKLGLDDTYGPTVGISITAHDVSLHPDDMDAAAVPLDEVSFTGWSAPLYGALGIDQLAAKKGDGRVAVKGRLDMLQAGIGLDITLAGEKMSADDAKRLWPYFLAEDSRDWFVKNVADGEVASANMRFNFPVGTLAVAGEEKPIPQGAMSIDMVGEGVVVRATETMQPVAIDGNTRLNVRDNDVTISADGGKIPTAGGDITVSNAALVIDSSVPKVRTLEISGDVQGEIKALLALAKDQQPEAVAGANLPIKLDALGGHVSIDVVATVQVGETNAINQIDYVLNGAVRNFVSTEPIQDRSIKNGQLAFSATQAGYHVTGSADIDGMTADLSVEGTPTSDPVFQLGSTLNVKELANMGFDASQFLSGQVRFVASPLSDGSIAMGVDLENAALDIADLGIRKAKGVKGVLKATVRQDGKLTELNDVSLVFGDVNLMGNLVFDGEKKQLSSAKFDTFALSPGDSAQVALAPIDGGYSVSIKGDQLDLKPMLQRFFGLGEGSLGSVASTSFNQTIALDVSLKRAVGFYLTTAYNLELSLKLRGSDLQRVSMQAQLGDDNAISVTTNPTPDGNSISVAFNDFGTLLRLIGVYPRVEGGEGSLVLATNSKEKVGNGQVRLRNFSLIDEDKVAEVLGNHQGSRQLIAKQNKLAFRSAELNFIRRSDRIEVTDAMLAGDAVGGTLKGFIYTDKRQYDLAGTYVPLFGLNSAFAKVPLFGPLLAGPDGAGMFGVTFAIRGALENPDFKINPASLLAVGAFRSLFEFRAKELPRE